ncbi:hypothetical protein VKS41_008413 [Umbelopsis sp. WA50703]
MSEKYSKLKVKELQELLQKHGLPHSGKKDELIERLVKHDEKKMDDLALEEELGNLEEFDEAKLEELAQDPEFKAMQQQAADSEKHTTAAAAEPSAAAPPSSDEKKPAEPVEQVKPGSNFKFTPITFDKPAESDAPSAPAKSEAERRLERAKRFGVAVQDTVKKELRAQKFGSTEPTAKAPAPAATADDAAAAAAPARPRASPVDDETLKKRAERFGLPTKTADKTAKPANGKKESPKAPLNPEEEEKKRKRAERFGKPAEPVEKKAKV